MTPKLLNRIEWLYPQTKKALLWLVNGDILPTTLLYDMRKQQEKYPDVQNWADLQEPLHLIYSSRIEQILYVADILCGTHGVEYLSLSEHDKRHSYNNSTVMAYYLNTGETYTTTLVYRKDIVKNWDVLSWGDLLEILEKKGYKIA